LSVLAGVSCLSSTNCTAVGNSHIGSTEQTLVEVWNGAAWSVVPDPPDSGGSLNSVSCSSVSECVAVGETSADETLVEAWDGSAWSIVPSPNLSSTGANFLVGVSCSSPGHCTAVGYAQGDSALQTLVELWNGDAWSIVSSPNAVGGIDRVLLDVSCPSATTCTAVGYSDAPGGSQSLVEAWNGSVWSIVPSPNVGSSYTVLDGVSCPSSTNCVAVGNGPSGQTLVESWDGSMWSIVLSPNVGGGAQSYFDGVSCFTPADCTAVGDAFIGSGYQTLIESWDGSVWSIVPSPDVSGSPSSQNQLLGVSCPGAISCTAVGLFGDGSTGQTLIEAGFSSLSITTTSLPDGTTGQPYSATLQATGGNPPYRWWYSKGGDLPRGLHFSTAGLLSGTPKKAGSYSVTLRVKDTKFPGHHINRAAAALTVTIAIVPTGP
jgi:hypothetical protein